MFIILTIPSPTRRITGWRIEKNSILHVEVFEGAFMVAASYLLKFHEEQSGIPLVEILKSGL